MTAGELINALQELISTGKITEESTVWEERAGEHRILNDDDVTVSKESWLYDADGELDIDEEADEEDSAPVVVFGAWD